MTSRLKLTNPRTVTFTPSDAAERATNDKTVLVTGTDPATGERVTVEMSRFMWGPLGYWIESGQKALTVEVSAEDVVRAWSEVPGTEHEGADR
jgi:hypothetical protein